MTARIGPTRPEDLADHLVRAHGESAEEVAAAEYSDLIACHDYWHPSAENAYPYQSNLLTVMCPKEAQP